MAVVRRLTPCEAVRQDVEAIAEIYRNLGAPVAEQLVTRALGELALITANVAEKVKRQDLRDLPRQLQILQRLAGDIGLTSLAHVSSDASACLCHGDATAFAAVWARLIRVAGPSLSLDPGAADFLV